MADSKITALTAISTVDPTADPLVIVDVSDTSMAASGTTKKSTINQLLGSGGTATLASATISGDLTVDTNVLKVDTTLNRVGIGTATPDSLLQMAGAGTINWKLSNTADSVTVGAYAGTTTGTTGTVSNHPFFLFTNNTERYRLASDGVATWSNVGGVAGTAMTLNSTGLGVGVTPITQARLSLKSSAGSPLNLVLQNRDASQNWQFYVDGVVVGDGILTINNGTSSVMQVTPSGNVGISVTPSAWATTTTVWRALDLQYSCGLASSGAGSGEIDLLWNAYYDQTDQRWEFKYTGDRASRYAIGGSGVHAWYNTASTGTANGAITWTQAMTLDASGNLIIGTTGTNWSTVAGFYYFAGSSLNITRDGNPSLLLNRLTSDGTIADFRRSGSAVGSISVTTTSTAYNTSSDYRLKESVAPLTGGLARISALKPSIYKWKADGSNGEGFIAHELAEVVPAAVSGEKDAVNEDGSIKAQGVDLSKVVPVLVAAIQELAAEVNALKNA